MPARVPLWPGSSSSKEFAELVFFENAGVAVLVLMYAALHRPRGDGKRAEPIVGVISQVSANRGRQPGAITHDARNLPSADDIVEPPRRAAEELLILADRQGEEIIGADVMPGIEIGGAPEFLGIENILDRAALLPGAGFGRRSRDRSSATTNS